MDALKVYDVKKICDARLCIVDMAAAFVRALVTVLLMGRVAVLYRYCAVLVTLFCTRGRRPASPAALCTRGRWPARMPKGCPAAALGHRSRRVLHGRHTTRPGLIPALAPVLAVGLAMHIQNRRDQTVPAIHRRGGGI